MEETKKSEHKQSIEKVIQEKNKTAKQSFLLNHVPHLIMLQGSKSSAFLGVGIDLIVTRGDKKLTTSGPIMIF